jgi:hypothetical protein
MSVVHKMMSITMKEACSRRHSLASWLSGRVYTYEGIEKGGKMPPFHYNNTIFFYMISINNKKEVSFLF